MPSIVLQNHHTAEDYWIERGGDPTTQLFQLSKNDLVIDEVRYIDWHWQVIESVIRVFVVNCTRVYLQVVYQMGEHVFTIFQFHKTQTLTLDYNRETKTQDKGPFAIIE